MLYGVLTGVLIVPQIHLGRLYSTPELALVVGNVFSYLVSSKRRVVLTSRSGAGCHPTSSISCSCPLSAWPSCRASIWSHARPPEPGQSRRAPVLYRRVIANRRHHSPGRPLLRTGSSFKRALRAMTNRTRLIGGPIAGDFVLPRDHTRKLVFIAGGVGITPYRSMLKYLLDTGERRDIVVFLPRARRPTSCIRMSWPRPSGGLASRRSIR